MVGVEDIQVGLPHVLQKGFFFTHIKNCFLRLPMTKLLKACCAFVAVVFYRKPLAMHGNVHALKKFLKKF